MLCVEPSCSLSVSQTLISSSSVVCSRSATLDRATVLLLRWNPAGPYSGSHLESSGSSAPVSVSVHPSRCSDHLFREWNLFCFISFLQCLSVAVFWHCISAATSTFMYCSETSVLCCTCWMYCTCGNFNGLCNVWTIMSIYCTWCISFLCTLNLGSLDLLGHLIHSSG